MVCGAHPHTANNLCIDCSNDMPWTYGGCVVCGQSATPNKLEKDPHYTCVHCLKMPPCYRQTVCAFNYLPPINGLINQFKHQRNLASGRLLGACLNKKISSSSITTWPQILLPVPLHNKRLRQRGFNQAQFIAAELSRSIGIKTDTSLCQRKVYQTPQQGHSRVERLAGMEGIFEISQHKRHQYINRVAIIDDVMTTGATAQALSQCLIDAWHGPLDIQIWCIARAQSPNVQINW